MLTQILLFNLGSVPPDVEGDGTPAILPNPADGDDNAGDDEDAFSSALIVLSGITSHTISNILVHNTSSQTAKLMGWIDFNQDGDFLDAGEQAMADVPPNQTTANLSWSGFSSTNVGNTYARFRLTTDPNLINSPASIGFAADGEVEDYQVAIAKSVDYGDAPSSFGDASHDTLANPVVYLGGIKPDGELATQLGSDAGSASLGDDNNTTPDDEDAFNVLANVFTTGNYLLNVPVINTNRISATLHAWIDFNKNGRFEVTEYTSAVVNNNNTSASLNWTIPPGTDPGNTYARFRLATDTINDDIGTSDLDERSFGNVSNGEVEDYSIAMISPISPLAGQLVINEVLYAQSGASAAENDEFIELFNPSSNAIDLSGFKLIDGNLLVSATSDPNALDGTVGSITGSQLPYVFPTGTILQPQQYAVIWIGNQTPEHSAAGAAFQAWLSKSAKLNDTGDDVWLYDASTRVIDYMAYGRNTSNSMGINTRLDPVFNIWNNTDEDKLDVAANGQSISLTPNGIDGNTSTCWEKTAIATNDPDSAITRCPNFLTTIDSDTLVINANQRITSVGGNNNGKGNLILVKRITNIFPNHNNVSFNTVIDDGISNNDDNNPKWKNNYLLGQIKVTGVKPGDEVEYTIYFLSNGERQVTNVQLCDMIPNNMTFVENNFAANFGMALAFNGTGLPTTPNKNLSNAIGDDDEGNFYPPGTNPPGVDLCKKSDPNDPNNLIPVDGSNNLSGAVLINLSNPLPPATAPGTPPNSYGFVRFRAKVK